MSRRRPAAEEPSPEGSEPAAAGAAPSTSQPRQGEPATTSPSADASRGAPRAPSRAGSATGRVVVSLIVAAAAIATAYWVATTHNARRPAPPNTGLREVARQLLHPNKGILAADESPTTFGKRLLPGIPNSIGVRRQWRRALLTAPELGEHISGVILHEETFLHQAVDVRAAVSRGVAVGIKLDEGTVQLQPKKAGERATKGLEGLAERCRRFREQDGATFAKWRAVFRVGRRTPSKPALQRNAQDLAEYAAVVQKCGLVPIIEPEVLPEGDHDLQRGAAASVRVLRSVFRALRRQAGVDVGAVLLKVAMVTPGDKAAERATPQQVANATLRVMMRTVPRVVPGIVFLSGGQSEEGATANLLALAQLVQEREQAGKPPLPWSLSFSFGRALQQSALAAWQRGDLAAAYGAFAQRARANALAQQGKSQTGVE